MKLKAKLDKIRNLRPQNLPCSVKQFGELRDGLTIEIKDDETAKEMLAMGVVEKTTTKKSKGE